MSYVLHGKKTTSHPDHNCAHIARARTHSAWTLSTASCGRQNRQNLLWMPPLYTTCDLPTLKGVWFESRAWQKNELFDEQCLHIYCTSHFSCWSKANLYQITVDENKTIILSGVELTTFWHILVLLLYLCTTDACLYWRII